MSPDGKTPLPSKRYYDIFTFFITQIAFAFTTSPFILLTFSATMTVWARVYFYTVIGTAVSFALFSRSLPVRAYLIKMQSARTPKAGADVGFDVSGIEKVAKEEVTREKVLRMESTDDVTGFRKAPTLGIADDPEAEIDEIVAEVKREIEERKRRGSLVQGFDVKKAVEEKLKEFQKR